MIPRALDDLRQLPIHRTDQHGLDEPLVNLVDVRLPVRDRNLQADDLACLWGEFKFDFFLGLSHCESRQPFLKFLEVALSLSDPLVADVATDVLVVTVAVAHLKEEVALADTRRRDCIDEVPQVANAID